MPLATTDGSHFPVSSGSIQGYPAIASSQISKTLGSGSDIGLIFGNWSDVLVADFNGGATDILVDPYTAAINRLVKIYAVHWWDVGIRHPASFSVIFDANC